MVRGYREKQVCGLWFGFMVCGSGFSGGCGSAHLEALEHGADVEASALVLGGERGVRERAVRRVVRRLHACTGESTITLGELVGNSRGSAAIAVEWGVPRLLLRGWRGAEPARKAWKGERQRREDGGQQRQARHTRGSAGRVEGRVAANKQGDTRGEAAPCSRKNTRLLAPLPSTTMQPRATADER